MAKSITLTLEVPEWVDEIRLKEEIYSFVRDFSLVVGLYHKNCSFFQN